jgi:hypothetical protein
LFFFGASSSSEGCCLSGGALSELQLLWPLPLELLKKARRNLGAAVRRQDHGFRASPLDGCCLRERRSPGGALSEPVLLWLLALELLLRERRVPGAVRHGHGFFFLRALCFESCSEGPRLVLFSDLVLEKTVVALFRADGARRRPFDLPTEEKRRRAPDRQEGGVVVVVIVVASGVAKPPKVVVPVDGRRRRGERRCSGGGGGPVLEGRRSAGSEKGTMAAAAVRSHEAPELPDRVPDGGAGAVLEELPPAVHELKEKQDDERRRETRGGRGGGGGGSSSEREKRKKTDKKAGAKTPSCFDIVTSSFLPPTAAYTSLRRSFGSSSIFLFSSFFPSSS